MKNKINSLKTELKQVMTDLRGQKVSYDEVQAEKKFTKIIEKERETEKVNYQEQIEQPNRSNEPTSDRIEEKISVQQMDPTQYNSLRPSSRGKKYSDRSEQIIAHSQQSKSNIKHSNRPKHASEVDNATGAGSRAADCTQAKAPWHGRVGVTAVVQARLRAMVVCLVAAHRLPPQLLSPFLCGVVD